MRDCGGGRSTLLELLQNLQQLQKVEGSSLRASDGR